ncbi:MAG: 2-dehydropantoate 2-reductase [Candidatus Bathyarchaeota archaeon]|nr:2-dehydropantoate 2-reductase [Candidatus Bathyarchaeota archaeon]MDH5787279.1 2-dehydropantoate 2-reductase [Candidatus Bathyarchaeota archaeon]
MDKPTIGVIGLGPVGSILATHLGKSGMDVILEDIAKELLIQISKEGMKVSGIRELSFKFDKVVGSLTELTKFEPDIIFITTKACFLKNVLAEIKPMYTPKMKIVSFQNGIDNERLIAETLKIDTAYRVIVNYAGNLANPGDVRMNWFQPPNYIGAFKNGLYTTDETTKRISDILTTCGLKTDEAPNIKKHIWEKAILNSALCSICALTRQTMKEAMDFEFTGGLATRVLEEGLAVAKADGHDFGENALNTFVNYLAKGGAHKPSMLVDVENKAMTEVDFLSGAIVAYGKRYGIKTPVNYALTNLLKGLESSYLKR